MGAALANLYPVPTTPIQPETSLAIHAVFPITTPWLRESTTSLAARDAIWGRFTKNAPYDRGVGQALSPAFPGFEQEQSDNNLQFAIGDVHTFSPTIVNELNIGFVRFRRERHSLDAFKRN